MRSTEERITRMHSRAAEIKRKADKQRAGIMGVISGALMVCLVFAIQQLSHLHPGIVSGQGTGSSMLSDSTGGYVLIAVIAFVAGTVVTALVYKYKKGTRSDNEMNEK